MHRQITGLKLKPKAPSYSFRNSTTQSMHRPAQKHCLCICLMENRTLDMYHDFLEEMGLPPEWHTFLGFVPVVTWVAWFLTFYVAVKQISLVVPPLPVSLGIMPCEQHSFHKYYLAFVLFVTGSLS